MSLRGGLCSLRDRGLLWLPGLLRETGHKTVEISYDYFMNLNLRGYEK